ncbi:hypothetical protein DAPPUDRAFT_265155 [Daphnia pulex]|uniref:Uncharacterized protein n=1 Tax=Daphnia pulex TaxID=6669 RepID=E9HSY8_DAPPU|nr:hypothetical protein DAPPUDRAFT_265155 [Daphnia pulex]|eukprot:EFX65135.1 hypothetical protein DAPPUDRAFT_265155 [Daphnia pulex]
MGENSVTESRSPSPNKRGSDNDVASLRRDIERQQILQRLIASQVPNNTSDAGGMDANVAAQFQLQLDLKAEKKVGITFARMMEMVKADITSSETETSAGEEQSKCIELVDTE